MGDSMGEAHVGDGARAPRVVVCLSGSVAAYKGIEVVRGLQKRGVEVRCALTEAAGRFVGAATLDALTGVPCATDLFSWPVSAMPHIDLGEWADLVVVAPASANILAKLACGLADDCVSATCLATPAPVMVCPAMNVHMWRHGATQANLATLAGRGVEVVAPDSGRLACGDVGEGKLADVEAIVGACMAALDRTQGGGSPGNPLAGSLAGRTVLVSAGPTHEAIDPVRYIANASSGKMGYALARAARDAGAHVVLVSGPVALAAPSGVECVPVTSAAEMLAACVERFGDADAAILAAAVADFTPVAVADHKIKKAEGGLASIELTETADILATLSASKGDRVVVGFAAETDDLLANARAKLEEKGCDLIVANDVSRADSTFGSDTDRVTFVTPYGTDPQPLMEKDQVAEVIVARLAALLAEREGR